MKPSDELRVQRRLKLGAIGPVGLAALAIGILSPALGLYALWPPIQVEAGPIAPLIYLAAMAVALPTAMSYAVLNAEAPSTGAGSTWLWRSLSPIAGYLLGLTMITYLAIGAIAQPLLFGLFARDLLAFAGFPPAGRGTMLASLFVITGCVMWATRRGADTSVRTAVILMIIESSVVVALALTILAVKLPQSAGVLFAPFSVSHASGGPRGFWRALIIGVLAFAGFDVVSTAAEETHAPHRQIPRATLLTVVGTGTFWVLSSWIYTLAVPASAVEVYTHQGMTAVTPLARVYWGGGSLLIILTALTGVIAIFISSILATSRLIFALARHGLLPDRYAELHPIYRVPSNAMNLVFLIVVLCNVITIALTANGVAGFVWWSNTMVFFLTLTFAGVNLANFLYFRRVASARFRWHLNVLVPALGLAANICLLYEAFFRSLLISNSGAGRSAVIFCLAVLTLWCACALMVRRVSPERLRGAPPIAVSPFVKSDFAIEQASET